MSSKLVSKLIVPFLRIPTMKFKNTTFKEDASKRDIEMFQFDQETAPLSKPSPLLYQPVSCKQDAQVHRTSFTPASELEALWQTINSRA